MHCRKRARGKLAPGLRLAQSRSKYQGPLKSPALLHRTAGRSEPQWGLGQRLCLRPGLYTEIRTGKWYKHTWA